MATSQTKGFQRRPTPDGDQSNHRIDLRICISYNGHGFHIRIPTVLILLIPIDILLYWRIKSVFISFTVGGGLESLLQDFQGHAFKFPHTPQLSTVQARATKLAGVMAMAMSSGILLRHFSRKQSIRGSRCQTVCALEHSEVTAKSHGYTFRTGMSTLILPQYNKLLSRCNPRTHMDPCIWDSTPVYAYLH